MKWYWWIFGILIAGCLIILILISIGAFMLLVEFPGLNIILLNGVREMTWQWTGWHPWIIVIYFFWMYLAIGIDIGVSLKKEGSCVYFQIPLVGIVWLPVLVWGHWKDLQEEIDNIICG